jgi:peptidoglycan hydrolase CwlO-like protein
MDPSNLPNPDIMKEAMDTISSEFSKVGNLPALIDSVHVTNQLRAHQESIDNHQATIEEFKTSLREIINSLGRIEQRFEQRFDNLEHRIKATYVYSLLTLSIGLSNV